MYMYNVSSLTFISTCIYYYDAHAMCMYMMYVVALIAISPPDVAEWIMNRSIYCSSEEDYTQQLSLAEIGSSAVIEYSFQFLEDFRDTSPVLPSQDTKFRYFIHVRSVRTCTYMI